LTRRHDTVWVEILGGGDEINVSMLLDGPRARDILLLHCLPVTPAHPMMRVFPEVLCETGDVLTADELAALPRQPPADLARPHRSLALDEPLLRALTHDGRAGYSALAEKAGSTPTTVRHRVEILIRDQVIRPAAEVDLALLGASAEALLWMTVEPGGLTRIAHALCSHPGVRFVATTTGASNLLVAADLAGLYAVLTETVGAREQVKEIETAPILHIVSRTGVRRSA
jgi:DNA-binding Lrp family transcriptional regulator